MSHRVFFASDLHLGVPNNNSSLKRELKFVEWLNNAVVEGATEIHLLGDLFEFWFEYKNVVPKGGIRLLGTIAKITDSGIPVHYHLGNHDLWDFGYLESEIGVTVHHTPVICEWDGLKCLVGHGDGIGPGDDGYKITKKIYKNRLAQFIFRWLHPDIGIKLAYFLSKNSRAAGGKSGGAFTSNQEENLFLYCVDFLKTDYSIDCFIFGHRHIPLDLELPNNSQRTTPSRYINIGDWITHYSSAKLIEGKLTLSK